jgi:drug/metabolite transporter (DMT)-like permease
MQRLSAHFGSLPGNIRGALWILLSAVIFTGTNALIKHVGTSMDSFQMVFFRGLFGTLFLLPIVWRSGGWEAIRSDRMNFHMARGLTGSLALMTIFYALTHMPLADVTGISFSRSLWVIVLAVLFLDERIRFRRSIATVTGFLGVLIMVRPGPEANPAAVAAVLNALFVAMSVVLIKRMTATEKPIAILFWGTLIPTFVTMPPAIVVWQAPTNVDLVLMAAIGGGLSVGHACLIQGLRAGEATAVMPFDYSRLILAGLAGYVFFAEVPDYYTIGGALMIIGSTYYIARREAKEARLARKREAETEQTQRELGGVP